MKIISRKVVAKTPIFTVSDNVVLDPKKHKIRRFMVEHKGSSVVFPVDSQGRILLVRQYRFPARAYMWELPAGKTDEGETALQGARREFKEETGFRARRWKRLIKFHPSPGFQQEHMSIYLAEDLIPGEAAPDHEEQDLELKWFTPEQMEDLIRKGRITDAKTIIGLYVWKHLSDKAEVGQAVLPAQG